MLRVLLVLGVLLGCSNGEMLGKLLFNDHSNMEKSSLTILHKPDTLHLAPNPGPIASDEVASLMALSLGLSVPRDVKWAGLQVANPFKLPKAAVMVSVDGLPQGRSLKMASEVSYPVENVGGDVATVNDFYHVAPKYSLSTHLGGIFEGKSKVVSVSGDQHVASSGHSNTHNTQTSTWSDVTRTWKVVKGGSEEVKTSLNVKDVLKRIPDVLVSGFVYHPEDHSVRVHTNNMEFSFNMDDDDVDFKLFSQLVYILHVVGGLAEDKGFAKDGAPDLFLLSVSALKGLEKKYGADSQQVSGALLLIENLIEKTTSSFMKLYNGDVVVVGVSVPSEASFMQQHQQHLKPIIKVLEQNHVMLLDLDNSGSEIHLMDKLESSAQKQLCKDVQGSLQQSSVFNFKCAQDIPTHKIRKQRSLLEAPDTGASKPDINLGSNYDDNFPVIFNIWFWLMVILLLTVYVVSIGMWNMDPGRDSIIYRLTQQKIKSE